MKKDLAPGTIAAVLVVVLVVVGVAAYFALRPPPIVRNARMPPGRPLPGGSVSGSQAP
jgi:hypothetical protein